MTGYLISERPRKQQKEGESSVFAAYVDCRSNSIYNYRIK